MNEIEITKTGRIQYKNKRKHERKTRKTYHKFAYETFQKLADVYYELKRRGFNIIKMDRPVLVDQIIEILECTKSAAYEYANILIVLNVS